MRLLVCGSRDYLDYIQVSRSIESIMEERDVDVDNLVVIQGGAKGADFLAKVWCYCYNGGWAGIQCIEYPANWKKYGLGAGPKRNQQMLDEGKPDLVLAFPGNTGTNDMITRAKNKGVEVVQV